jgi:transcriptional regulator with XRE-family HTH domain
MDARRLVGWNLRRLRVAKELTIEELAHQAGVGESYLSRLERGEENVGIVLLSKLARVLGAHLTELVVEPAPGDKPPQRLKAGRRPTKSTSRCRTA